MRINLLSNATKFTKNGTISLCVSRRQDGDNPASVTLSVADSGTGLGLVIARYFCQMLGGDIDVTSTAGQGSKFTITLPDRPEKAKAAIRTRLPAAAAAEFF
ncbi:MAG: ATP-binding protein [Pseudolabrys sp.]